MVKCQTMGNKNYGVRFWYKICCIILVLGVIIDMDILGEENNGLKNAEVLMNEYLINETAFIEKYTNKKIIVTGIIFEKATPKDNIPEKDFNYIVFGDYIHNRISIQFYFNEYIYWNINKDDKITIEGNFREIKKTTDFMTGKIKYITIIFGGCKIK